MTRTLSPRGEALIKSFEQLELEAYPDPGSPLGRECTKLRLPMRDYRKVPDWQDISGKPWTIGWGTTRTIYPGDKVTQEQAQALFNYDVRTYVNGVNRLVTAPLTQNQFDALVCFAYNVGLDEDTDQTPEGLGDSTLLKYLNQHKYVLAAGEFAKWNKSGGRVMLGLVRRRKAEHDLFIAPDDQPT